MEKYSLYCHSWISYRSIRKGWVYEYLGGGGRQDLFKKIASDKIVNDST